MLFCSKILFWKNGRCCFNTNSIEWFKLSKDIGSSKGRVKKREFFFFVGNFEDSLISKEMWGILNYLPSSLFIFQIPKYVFFLLIFGKKKKNITNWSFFFFFERTTQLKSKEVELKRNESFNCLKIEIIKKAIKMCWFVEFNFFFFFSTSFYFELMEKKKWSLKRKIGILGIIFDFNWTFDGDLRAIFWLSIFLLFALFYVCVFKQKMNN